VKYGRIAYNCVLHSKHQVHSFSDSGVGLHEEEEATVNKLINQLEAVGKQQVRAAVPAAPASFDPSNQVLCHAGTSSSGQPSDLWELWGCLFINTASPKTEWAA
jgi:hypothetical protein